MNYGPSFVTCFLIFKSMSIIKSEDVTSNIKHSINIDDIAEALFLAIGVKNESISTRTKDLKEKIKTINSYAVDKDKYVTLIRNVTMETVLNETDFYRALNEDDEFKFLKENAPKSLYLKMKERMNRDDILEILKENINSTKLAKTARRVNDFDYFGKNDEEILDTVVDKMIGEAPADDHKFDDKINASIYWDPERELQDLKEHHTHDGRRIFKGERTTVRYYPFMVSVHVMGRFWCGGVLYFHDLVLTSAACLQLMHNNRFFRENPRVLQIRVGSNHTRIGGEVFDALEVYFHPSYNPRTLRNNIAVIRLQRHVMFSYHRTPKIIPISHNPTHLPATAEVLVLGWGVTKVSQKISYEPVFLQRKILPIYPNEFCKEVYGEKFITKEMFCAGTFTTGEGACDHDAGGPAILAGRLVGIISFGPAVCGSPNAPTVFTHVGAFAKWIENVNETMPSYYRARVRTTTTTHRPFYEYLLTHLPRPSRSTIDANSISPFTIPSAEVTDVTSATGVTGTTTTRPALRMRYGSEDDSWEESISAFT